MHSSPRYKDGKGQERADGKGQERADSEGQERADSEGWEQADSGGQEQAGGKTLLGWSISAVSDLETRERME
jgi:hypothetical protein